MNLTFARGGVALALLAACAPAMATLGEDVSSVALDQARLQAQLQISDGAQFAVHRLRLASGTSVSEYVTPAGLVFALTWQGPAMPDLQQLLGRYFAAYVRAQKEQGASAARTSTQPDLVVQTGGHMRAYFGRVYVPTMLPRGVTQDEIR